MEESVDHSRGLKENLNMSNYQSRVLEESAVKFEEPFEQASQYESTVKPDYGTASYDD